MQNIQPQCLLVFQRVVISKSHLLYRFLLLVLCHYSFIDVLESPTAPPNSGAYREARQTRLDTKERAMTGGSRVEQLKDEAEKPNHPRYRVVKSPAVMQYRGDKREVGQTVSL